MGLSETGGADFGMAALKACRHCQPCQWSKPVQLTLLGPCTFSSSGVQSQRECTSHQAHAFRGRTGQHLCMALWSVGTNNDLDTIFCSLPKYFLMYFAREETFLVRSSLSVLLGILCPLICWNFHSFLLQHMLEDSNFLTLNAASIS